MEMGNIQLSEFQYDLPEESIAKFPLKNRSESKLLIYNQAITHSRFFDIRKHLPEDATIVFNNTRVIPARLYMQKETGSNIEVFLTEPVAPHKDFAMASQAKSPVTWKCIVGNKRKWKNGQVISTKIKGTEVLASWENREEDLVMLTWDSGSFHDMIEQAGNMPLPPYMNRRAVESDKDRYQTVYGKKDGAVAAPTAGLHFTPEVLSDLGRDHTLTEVTLHVSAGTFKPVSAGNVVDHDMHREFIQIKKSTVEELLRAQTLVLTGTTTLRTLESLYWYGVKVLRGSTQFIIEKLYPYQNHKDLPLREESLEAILNHMDISGMEELTGSTEIFIIPGYKFRMTDALITNFHLPGSTLILLVAALVGDHWKNIYREALNRDYRFLSYGDSSLLFRS